MSSKRKDLFNLNALQGVLLQKTLKKCGLQTKSRFYKTSRGLKTFIDVNLPRMTMETLRIVYFEDKCNYTRQRYSDTVDEYYEVGEFRSATPDDTDLITFHPLAVYVGPCKPDFFENTVLSDLVKLSGVQILNVTKTEEKNLSKILEVCQPKLIHFSDHDVDEQSPYLQNIKHIAIMADETTCEQYWKIPDLVLQMGRRRKTVAIIFPEFYREVLLVFLKGWFSGENTGQMEGLSVWLSCNSQIRPFEDGFRWIIDEELPQMKKKSFARLNDQEIVLERMESSGRNKLIMRKEQCGVRLFLV